MKIDNIKNDLRQLKMRNYYRVWEPFMRKYRCNYICELGICYGGNFKEMIAHKPKLAVAVDSWKDDGVESRNDGKFSQKELDKQYKDFVNLMSDKPYVNIIRDYTFNAVKIYPDNFFDFVYIDADHSYNACIQDITDWYLKVKPGKFLVGHDYGRRFPGVVEAVNKFTKENNLELIFLPPSTWAVIKA